MFYRVLLGVIQEIQGKIQARFEYSKGPVDVIPNHVEPLDSDSPGLI